MRPASKSEAAHANHGHPNVGPNQGQARGIWTYHSLKFEIWLYHEGPTLQSRITQKWLELSLSFFHIMKIWDICGHLQLV